MILGDLNASAVEGDSTGNPIGLLVSQTAINTEYTPLSAGASENEPGNPHAAAHTARWGMRADYVLPSTTGLQIVDGGVFWPAADDPLQRLTDGAGRSTVVCSDHRLVWLDLTITPADR